MAKNITMPLHGLVKEHIKLVRVLRQGGEKQRQEEGRHQAKELAEYRSKNRKGERSKGR
jgi:hypothetical protein